MVIYRSGYQERLERAATELAARIVRNMDPDRVILFGSVASGDAGPASDVDLLVIKPSGLTFKERIRRIYAELDRTTDVDLLWYTPEEVRRLQSSSSFVRHALATGRLLYERT